MLGLGGSSLPELESRVAKNVRTQQIVLPEARPPNGALIDAEGHAHRHYGAAIIVVRPDGYIGYASASADAPAGASRYFARFFS